MGVEAEVYICHGFNLNVNNFVYLFIAMVAAAGYYCKLQLLNQPEKLCTVRGRVWPNLPAEFWAEQVCQSSEQNVSRIGKFFAERERGREEGRGGGRRQRYHCTTPLMLTISKQLSVLLILDDSFGSKQNQSLEETSVMLQYNTYSPFFGGRIGQVWKQNR